MLTSSTTKLITPVFMKNSPTQCLFGNSSSNNSNIIRKTVPRVRIGISKIETLVQKTLLNEKSPSYLFDLIPNLKRVHKTIHSNNIPAIHVKHDYFKNSFFYSVVSKWDKVDWEIRNSGSPSIFKKYLLNFI